MGSLNLVQIIGRAGKDPEVREFAGGGKVVNFSVATSSGKDKNGQELTEWHRASAFISEKQKVGQIIADYVKKGSLVYISGQLRTRQWEKDGVKQSSTEILVNQVQLLSPKSATTIGPGASTMSGSEQAPIYNDLDSEIPF